jgi:hypothetical protein
MTTAIAKNTRTVDGVLVCMSAGLYIPMIETVDYADPDPYTRKSLCDYRSQMAMDAGLSNPRHWAHAVYRTLARLCEEHQEELQGGDMAAYDATQTDRDEANEARRHGFGT